MIVFSLRQRILSHKGLYPNKRKKTIMSDLKISTDNQVTTTPAPARESTQPELTDDQKAKLCTQCNEYKNWMMKYSPSVIFMFQQIKQAGGYVSPQKIKCEICTDPKLGGFHPELGIQLCANYIPDKWVLNDTLSHELIHWYDNTRFKVDWMDLKHHACSEIRAASLSGECAIMTEFWKNSGMMKISKGHQVCVKRRAALSVVGHPKCKDMDHANEVVDEVFRSCFNDTRPFEMIYR